MNFSNEAFYNIWRIAVRVVLPVSIVLAIVAVTWTVDSCVQVATGLGGVCHTRSTMALAVAFQQGYDGVLDAIQQSGLANSNDFT